jgi:hypothetical protein
MTWILYDTNLERARNICSVLMSRCGIEALPYQEIRKFLSHTQKPTTLLVHCDAVQSEFFRVASLKRSGRHLLRFYCTEARDKMPQVAYFPDEAETLVC